MFPGFFVEVLFVGKHIRVARSCWFLFQQKGLAPNLASLRGGWKPGLGSGGARPDAPRGRAASPHSLAAPGGNSTLHL